MTSFRAPAAGFRLLGLAILVAALASCTPAMRDPERSTPNPETVVADDTEHDPAEVEVAEPARDDGFRGLLELPPPGAEVDDAPAEELTPAPIDELTEEPPELPEDRAARERELAESSVPTFDIQIDVNDEVLRWLDYYSVRRKDSFVQGLIRSGAYVERFREIFAEAGVPRDLVYMAHVESAYKTTAYSRAHAKGIYQFISGTGRRYGLRIDWYVDERSDPEKSAKAAAAYLRELYDEFGDWYLALAGYNAGEGRVRRSIAKSGSRDFWELSRRRFFRRETRNYVPAILAAILISKEPAKYGFEFDPAPALVYDTIRVEGAVDLRVLANCGGTTPDTLRTLNPALRRMQTPPDGIIEVHVPVGTGEATMIALADVPTDERVLFTLHRVRQGDTLGELARRYGVSVSSIQQANNLGRSTMIRAGKTLRIPSSSAAATAIALDHAAIVVDHAAIASGEPTTYTVRRGDTLWAIATRYGTTPASIAAHNGRSVHDILGVGDRLTVVPGSTASPTASAASAETVRYTVRRGDTLSSIASRHGTTAEAIAAASSIRVRSTIHPGDRLTVPAGHRTVARGDVAYTVRRGDSLWKIANRHRTSIDAICEANGIGRSATLQPGTRLTIPVP